jgi:biofilm PGA synthesis N-glycosyltransferase PgaC
MMIVFWISALSLFHAYAGYAISVWLVTRCSRKASGLSEDKAVDSPLPRIAFIIPAYNEREVIVEKCLNTLALQYPADLMDIIVVTDGSTDGTQELAESVQGVRVLHQPTRAGKAAAMNRAVALVLDAEILFFSDANTMLNQDALLRMMPHYRHPETGGVAGEKKVVGNAGHPVQGEGLYWRYESAMKRLDSSFHSLIAAAGELISLRRTLWSPIPEDTILDDMFVTVMVCRKGLRFHYEPKALATEPPSPKLAMEQERKTRIASGAFQFMFRHPLLLNPFGHFRRWYTYVSRRVFRWVIAPLAIPLLYLSNLSLIQEKGHYVFYEGTLMIQTFFFFLAGMGWLISRFGVRQSVLLQAPFYFVFMHVSMYRGFFRFLSGRQTSSWEKVSRL